MSAEADFVVRGAQVVDGTGAARYRADVAVQDGMITAVAEDLRVAAAKEVDGQGYVLSPRFIDAHTHDDNAVFTTPLMEPKISQGVTTVVAGNCGISLAPLSDPSQLPPPLDLLGDRKAYRFPTFASYLAAVEADAPAVNVASLIGHMTLRVGAGVDPWREATAVQMESMKAQVIEAMDAGAIGFSTGFWYAPSEGATVDEVAALTACVADAGGIYATHMRNESDKIFESLDESFSTARRAGARLVISHHKVAGKPLHGLSVQTLDKIAEAMREQEIGLDAYPYSATSTVIRPHMVGYSEKTMISWSVPHPEMTGRFVSDIAKEWGVSDTDAAVKLAPGGAVYWLLAEADVQRILAFPHTMIGSDGLPHDQHPHPRLWGTFPRVLGHYGRKLGLFSLEEAVRKMTGLPAANFSLDKRGLIKPGFAADLVLFDAETVLDRATYEQPTQLSAGIEKVYVNGACVWESGRATGARPGRTLKRRARRPEAADDATAQTCV